MPMLVVGTLVKVDGNNLVVMAKAMRMTTSRTGDESRTTVTLDPAAEPKEVTVATDDKTVVTLDDKDAKLADLKADMFVRITPATGTAEKVNAFTKAPERKRKPKEDAPKE